MRKCEMKRKAVTSKEKKKKRGKGKNLSKKDLSVSEANAKRPLYSLRDDVTLHPELLRYDLNVQVRGTSLKPIPSSTKGKPDTAVFLVPKVDGTGMNVRPGLVNKIKKRFYPFYKPVDPSKRSKKVKRKGAGKIGGKNADRDLHLVVQNKGMRPPRCSQYAVAVLEWWAANGHELQGSQLPVDLEPNGCATCGDYFTAKKGLTGELELWYWELKCGWPPGATMNHGKMLAPLNEVDCKPFNIWELQRQFTHWAYEEQLGMKIHASRVIHVYKEDGKGMVVNARPIPSWCTGMSKVAHYATL